MLASPGTDIRQSMPLRLRLRLQLEYWLDDGPVGIVRVREDHRRWRSGSVLDI